MLATDLAQKSLESSLGATEKEQTIYGVLLEKISYFDDTDLLRCFDEKVEVLVTSQLEFLPIPLRSFVTFSFYSRYLCVAVCM